MRINIYFNCYSHIIYLFLFKVLFALCQVIVTQIGTLENTPREEVRMILSGLGGRRRGLSRPSKKATISTTTTEPAPFPDINLDDYYYYDEYEYPQLSEIYV